MRIKEQETCITLQEYDDDDDDDEYLFWVLRKRELNLKIILRLNFKYDIDRNFSETFY